MNKELIKKLKDNKVGWMFLSEEEQNCLMQANDNVGVENLMYDGEWEGIENPWADLSGGKNSIWRIKPDYQPEPVFVNLKITYNKGLLCAYREDVAITKENFADTFIPINYLPSLPNFQGFFSGDMKLRFDEVSTHMEGEPYARFRV